MITRVGSANLANSWEVVCIHNAIHDHDNATVCQLCKPVISVLLYSQEIMEALETNTTLQALRLSNQVCM